MEIAASLVYVNKHTYVSKVLDVDAELANPVNPPMVVNFSKKLAFLTETTEIAIVPIVCS